ncbi:unnamed protein product [[Candida] boidinii]|nr:unnamed protein product [[Candida] boidinii]
MFIPIALAIFGFFWLLNRFLSLLLVPITKIIKSLNISIPTVPLISVDKVSDNSMVLHWNSSPSVFDDSEKDTENEKTQLTTDGPPILQNTSPSAISHYVLYINGLKAAIIDGNSKSCVVEGLLPDSNYQVDIVAFNMANFRSKSSPIYVKTRKNPILNIDGNPIDRITGSSTTNHPDDLLFVLAGGKNDKITKHPSFRQSSPHDRTRSRSNTIDRDINNTSSSNNHNNNNNNNNMAVSTSIAPNLITDIEELRFLLETGLDEVRELMKSYKESSNEFKEEESNLLAEREEARERRKIEASNRTSLKNEIKYLEEARRKSENKVSQNQSKLQERLKKINKKEEEIEKWKLILKQKTENYDNLSRNENFEKTKLNLKIENLNKDIFSIQSENHDIEEDIKDELANRKKLDLLKQQLTSLFETLKKATDMKSGLVGGDGVKAFDSITAIKPEWKEDILRQIVLDSEAESHWRALQQKEFRRYAQLKNELASFESYE